MIEPPSSYVYHPFPLETIAIKHVRTGQLVESRVIRLTRWGSRYRVDRPWSRFRGPYVHGFDQRPDAHWKWNSFVRRHQKRQDWVRCGAIETPDGKIQGAIIYRRDGASLLEPGQGAVYVEYLAAAPSNRKDCARKPEYEGVGSGLLTLAILHSYDWGSGGRVALHSLPTAIKFYKQHDFVKTNHSKDRMIHCEIDSREDVSRLEGQGLI